MTLSEYFNNNKSILFKKNSNNSYNIKVTGKTAKLIGTCTNESINIDLISKSGKTLLSFNEDFSRLDNPESFVVNKLSDAYEAFNDVSSLELDNDLKHGSEEHEKELLLDDNCESSIDNINSLSELRYELNSIINRSQNLLNNYKDSKISTKALIVNGIIQSIYETIDNLDEIIEYEPLDGSENVVRESMSIPAKTDYIDLACKGLSQASVALKGSDYEDLIGKLRDIRSELKISR